MGVDTSMLNYTVIKANPGWVAILASNKGLVATTLPQRSEQHALMALGQEIGEANPDSTGLEDIVKRLLAYFEGEAIDFKDKIDPKGTPFQKRVWETTRRIPYGETRSYLWIARQIRRPRAARAVGQALGANPLPIIVPCHRVVTNDGGLGGFGGGTELKQKLLKMESRGKDEEPKAPGLKR
jgi:methylated-DNA-[protein]-cysteine S-methyltransferase